MSARFKVGDVIVSKGLPCLPAGKEVTVQSDPEDRKPFKEPFVICDTGRHYLWDGGHQDFDLKATS